MNRHLTMDEFKRWTPEQQGAVRVWLRDHDFDPGSVLELFLTEQSFSVARIVIDCNDQPRNRLDGQGFERDIVTRPLKRPFPVEAA